MLSVSEAVDTIIQNNPDSRIGAVFSSKRAFVFHQEMFIGGVTNGILQ